MSKRIAEIKDDIWFAEVSVARAVEEVRYRNLELERVKKKLAAAEKEESDGT